MARRRRKIDYKKQITDSDIKAVSDAYNRKKDDCINELSKKTDRFFKNAQFERGQFYDAESYINYCNEASRRLLATINENVLTGKGLRNFIYEQISREPEVVSPLSTMKQAVIEALASQGSQKQPVTINISLDTRSGKRLLSKEIIADINDITESTGKVPIKIKV